MPGTDYFGTHPLAGQVIRLPDGRVVLIEPESIHGPETVRYRPAGPACWDALQWVDLTVWRRWCRGAEEILPEGTPPPAGRLTRLREALLWRKLRGSVLPALWGFGIGLASNLFRDEPIMTWHLVMIPILLVSIVSFHVWSRCWPEQAQVVSDWLSWPLRRVARAVGLKR